VIISLEDDVWRGIDELLYLSVEEEQDDKP